MSTIRSFIAAQLSDHARTELSRLQEHLKALIPHNTVRWTVPKNIHLTLHFLGDLPEDRLPDVSRSLHGVATSHRPFFLHLSNLGCFPNPRRPRIVWVGLSGETDLLVAIQRDLGELLNKAIGFEPESRPYSPHLTIGRVKKGIPQKGLRDLGQALEKEMPRVGEVAPLPVDAIHLIRSDLRPDGPVYSTLASGKLG
jgi:2'-5' RNA ligase